MLAIPVCTSVLSRLALKQVLKLTQPTQQPHHVATPGSPPQSQASESQLLLVDVWTAWTVINLVRKRAIASAFGVVTRGRQRRSR